MLKQYATKLYQKRLIECMKPHYQYIIYYKFSILTIGKLPNLFYRHINSSKNVKNSWWSSRIIYYGLIDKKFTFESQIAYISDRLAMVKFYFYITIKVIFCIKPILK